MLRTYIDFQNLMGLYKIAVVLIKLIELDMTNNAMYNVSEDVCHIHFLVFTLVFNLHSLLHCFKKSNLKVIFFFLFLSLFVCHNGEFKDFQGGG